MADAPDGVRKGGRYLSYLLRLWHEEKASTSWRASLESVDNTSRIGLSSLEALFEYIRQKTAEQCDATDVPVAKEVERNG